jgi:thiol-disulfide isomerase/thioredoxin
MLGKRVIPILFCGYALALSGCVTESSGLGPLVYNQEVSGNISTILWPAGAARANDSVLYAPNFRWYRADSTLDSLSNHHGQVVIINFWATWCVYCKTEMPAIQSAANQMGDSLFVIGVSDDSPGNPFNTVSSYVKSNGYTYTYQFAIDSLFTLYYKYFPDETDFVLPQSCFIDPQGRLQFTVIGEMPNEQYILSMARTVAGE